MDDFFSRYADRIVIGDPDTCWEWTGAKAATGYGHTHLKGKHVYAHRASYESVNGLGSADGLVVRHTCDNPPCCNPAHLYVGSRKQNVGDAVERARLWQLKVVKCPKGHDYTYNPSGRHRRCKKCEAAGQRKARTLDRTKCRNGHRLEGDNVILCKNGTRKCRICDAARVAKVGQGADGKFGSA